MRIAIIGIVALALLLPVTPALAADDVTDETPAKTPVFIPKTDVEKLSYAIGANIGRDFRTQKMEIVPEVLAVGLKDALAGEELALTENELREAMTTLRTRMMAKQRIQDTERGKINVEEGKAFLAENAKKKGVVTLPSGLQYKIITKGDGPSPKLTDRVSTHYRGTLIDGTEFDSSYKRGEPAKFAVNGVIKGWTEALQLMKVGSKWQLFVPAKLAYGSRGAGGTIGPNTTLIFEVELLSIADALDIQFEKPK